MDDVFDSTLDSDKYDSLSAKSRQTEQLYNIGYYDGIQAIPNNYDSSKQYMDGFQYGMHIHNAAMKQAGIIE